VRWQRIASSAASPRHLETDPDRAHRAALERGDEVVQQLAIAKYALTIGDTERAMAAIDAALATSRRSLTDLLRTVRSAHRPSLAGVLVRTIAAASSGPGRPAPAEPASQPEQLATT
jgi:hypothetical protein